MRGALGSGEGLKDGCGAQAHSLSIVVSLRGAKGKTR